MRHHIALIALRVFKAEQHAIAVGEDIPVAVGRIAHLETHLYGKSCGERTVEILRPQS